MNKFEQMSADGRGAEAAFGLHAYRRMHFIRMFEQRCMDLSAAKAVAGSIHLCAGQEAVPVGAAAALKSGDAVVCTYRGHGWALEFGITADDALAEICHRATGINGGRAGSALIMAPWRGFIGENSIVGAGVPIAAGVAMAEQSRKTGAVAVVSIGDGATSQGGLHEGIIFAAARKLPLLIVIENNEWSEMTPTQNIVGIDRLARRASGYALPGVTIDGTDPMAVRETIAIAAERAREGQGPSLIECRVPRLWGHYNGDIEHYRPKADRAAAGERDPIVLLSKRLMETGAATADELTAICDDNERAIADLARQVVAAPLPDIATARDHVVSSLAAAPSSGSASSERELTYIQAVNTALADELRGHDTTLVYGEDCGHAGGIFGATRDLQRQFGTDRVFDTPIAESAIMGSAIGAALRGMRPIVEIMWADFMLVALDQIVNQAANVRYLTAGRAAASIVIRMQQGATPGSCAQHSQSLEALLCHIPGLRVGLPSHPQDAYDMLRAAAACDDPVVIVEARSLYQRCVLVRTGGDLQQAQGSRWRNRGSDVTIICWGTSVFRALEAADQLKQEGTSAGVLDLRWLSPLSDDDLLDAVVAGNGRVVIAHEANLSGGVGGEISARLHERYGDKLRAPVRRVGAPDVRIPASPVLQAALLPNADKIIEAVRSIVPKH
ncbi:MAG: thiamine pyrophosphate-dependent enzyme [Pseudolabrys sp.]